MTVRRATVWVLECDAPGCLKLATPAELRSEQQERGRRALSLSHPVDAFTAAEEAGWVTEPRFSTDWTYYCPRHVDVPDRPQRIREYSAPVAPSVPPLRSEGDAPLAARPIEDVPLSGMD